MHGPMNIKFHILFAFPSATIKYLLLKFIIVYITFCFFFPCEQMAIVVNCSAIVGNFVNADGCDMGEEISWIETT